MAARRRGSSRGRLESCDHPPRPELVGVGADGGDVKSAVRRVTPLQRRAGIPLCKPVQIQCRSSRFGSLRIISPYPAVGYEVPDSIWMADDGYLVEQVILLVVFGIIFVLSALQIAVEYRMKSDIARYQGTYLRN